MRCAPLRGADRSNGSYRYGALASTNMKDAALQHGVSHMLTSNGKASEYQHGATNWHVRILYEQNPAGSTGPCLVDGTPEVDATASRLNSML